MAITSNDDLVGKVAKMALKSAGPIGWLITDIWDDSKDDSTPEEDYYEDWSTKGIEELAQKSNAAACFVLAERYAEGTKILKRDLQKAQYWYDKVLLKVRSVDLAHLRDKARFVSWLVDRGQLEAALDYAGSLTNSFDKALFYHKMYAATGEEKYRDEAVEKYKASLKAPHFDHLSSDSFNKAELEDNFKVMTFNFLAGLVSDPMQKRHFLIGALKNKSIEAKEAFNEIDKRMIEGFDKASEASDDKATFSAVKYNERQFIYFVKDVNAMASCYDENFPWVFTVDNYPKEIQFPAIGHPQANALYIAHPAKKGMYLPMENASSKLFDDKVSDFCWLAQCLGATEITCRSVKGKSVAESLSKKYNAGVSGEYNGSGASAEYGNGRSNSQKESRSSLRAETMVFKPTKAAYIPDDTAWLSIDSEWQRLVKQRMEGMCHYTVKVSSKESMAVADSRMDEVKLAVKTFGANAQGNYSQQKDQTLQREEETEWEISVTFMPLDELASLASDGRANGGLSKNEQEYLDDLKELLEDNGEITLRERKMLERRREFLGISEVRAAELEASLKPQLTEDEQEYLDMYREYAAKGEITEKERRRLAKFAMALGLDEKRIKEIVCL